MTDPERRVPVALRLAARLLPKEVREEVLGDLWEAWWARRRTRSRWSVALWTVRQPFAALQARSAGPDRAELSLVRGGPRFAFSWIDVKLGVRMLSKQPILSFVAGLTLAVGIPAALGITHLLGAFEADLPVDEGDRIVGLRHWDVEGDRADTRLLHEYTLWREALATVEDVGAARSAPRNVHSEGGSAGDVLGAEVTASVFDLLGVPPLLGRTLVPEDEVEGAPDVVVISEDLWESRFGRDPAVVGRTIGVGRATPTVVGVMPEGFYFPRRDHVWLPLRADPDDYAVGDGPELLVVGRLAEGVSERQAEAELGALGANFGAQWPDSHDALREEVVRYPVLASGQRAGGIGTYWEFRLLQLLSFGLLAVVCGNIGTLILARTAMRLNELSVRTALGASRLRLLSQLFVEALVLSLGATGAGLLLAQLLLVPILRRFEGQNTQYWIDLSLTPRTVWLAFLVGAGCAVLAGVLPAIKATSPRIRQNLQGNSRGATLRFGPVTSLLIVTEVALSVGFLCFGTGAVRSFAPDVSDQSDFDMDRYLVARFRTPPVTPTEDVEDGYQGQLRVRASQNNELLRDRLAADPSVVRVAMGLHLPGRRFREQRVELEGGPGPGREIWTLTGDVHVDFFRDLGLRVLEGRDFARADVETGPDADRSAVVVNQQFVEQVLGGGDAVGQRLMYLNRGGDRSLRSYEIIGVVETFGTNVTDLERRAAIYHPFGSGDRQPMGYVIEVAAGDAAAFIPRLREIATAVDPAAIIQGPESVAQYVSRTRMDDTLLSLGLFVLSVVGMLLAATGLYALVSVTVSQRTKEIGIRTALGAGARDVVVTIARRAFMQLAVGVALGSGMGAWILSQFKNEGDFAVDIPVLVAGVAAAATILAALACLQPTLRGLRIQPTEALGEA